MRNDDERKLQLETALADRFDRDDEILMREVERITDLNAEIVQRINDMKQETQEYVCVCVCTETDI